VTNASAGVRSQHAATLLPAEGAVAGGYASRRAIARSCMIRRPGRGRPPSTLSAARQAHTATLLPTGGCSSRRIRQRVTRELTNPSAERGRQPAPEHRKRFAHDDLLPNGKVWSGGATTAPTAASPARSCTILHRHMERRLMMLITARSATRRRCCNGKALITGAHQRQQRRSFQRGGCSTRPGTWTGGPRYDHRTPMDTATLLPSGKVLSPAASTIITPGILSSAECMIQSAERDG